MIIDGKRLSSSLRADIKLAAQKLIAGGVTPALAIVIATDDESALLYVHRIARAAKTIGLQVLTTDLGAQATAKDIQAELTSLAAEKNVHGIILQTPLPASINAAELRTIIPPEKDIDGANPISAGRLLCGMPAFAPSTAAAVMYMLKQSHQQLEGKRAVIVGRSLVVGKPLAHLLLAANATVTICHSRTQDLANICREAEILVVAIGQPKMVNASFVATGAVVIDVGTNVLQDGGLVGDVDSESIESVAGAHSPVPGGVGPVTTIMLLKQTVDAASQQTNM